MKKVVSIIICSFGTLSVFSQRYTGYGRGVDWEYTYGGSWIDLSFLCIIAIMLVLGFILIGFNKIRGYIPLSPKGLVPFMLFKSFRQFKIITLIGKEDGDINNLCVFTNIFGNKTFVAFSPYLGEITLNEINKNKMDFYINWKKRGCYFLCTKESEGYKKENKDEPAYYMCEYDLECLLYQLNVKRNLNNYTFKRK